jgi:hypothetical protein
MVPFTYRCPRTGQQVQGWAIDALAEGELYEPVTCTLREGSSRQPQIREGAGTPKRNRAASTACCQLRQLGDIHRDPPRLILAEQLGCEREMISPKATLRSFLEPHRHSQ